LDEKPSKSLSLAMRKLEEAARRAMVEGAGEKAAEYLSAEAAREVIMRELKDAMVSTTLGTKSEPNIGVRYVAIAMTTQERDFVERHAQSKATSHITDPLHTSAVSP
jgi:hypothetical protein